MRRQRRSYLASFIYGVVIASGTAAGLMITHHVLAPPAGDDVAEGAVATEALSGAGVRRWARQPETPTVQPPAAPMEPRLVSGPTPASPPVKAVRISDPPPKSGEAQRALSRNIQRELQRVGCYAGSVDGDWTPATQSAMRAFNDSVRVQLPVTAPDYILLTLLQGHTTRACRSADPTITAKVQPTRPTTRAEAPSPASPVQRPATIAQPSPSVQPAPSPLVPPVAVTAPVAGPVVIPSAAPLPGRMAIGAPPAQIAPPTPYATQPAAVPPPSVTETVYPQEPPKATDRRASPPRATPRRASSPRGTFSDLNRSAP